MSFTFFSGTTPADNMPLLQSFYTEPTGISIDYANSRVVYGTFTDFLNGGTGSSISASSQTGSSGTRILRSLLMIALPFRYPPPST